MIKLIIELIIGTSLKTINNIKTTALRLLSSKTITFKL